MSRAALAECPSSSNSVSSIGEVPHTVVKKRKVSKTSVTVEEHLRQEYEEIENQVRAHTNSKIQALQEEFNKLRQQLLVASGLHAKQPAYQLTLEATEGPYTGKLFTCVLRLDEETSAKKAAKSKKNARDKTKEVTVFIGRSRHVRYTKNGISLSKDDSVSMAHAEIKLVRGQGLFIEDRGTTNGTMLDGTELVARTPKPLVDGQEVYFGTNTRMKIDICTLE